MRRKKMKGFFKIPGLLRRSDGISMIEVMVAIGMLTAVVFAFLSWVNTFSKGMNNLTETTEIENAMLRLTAAFGDSEEYCGKMLGAGPSGPTLAAGVLVPPYPAIDHYVRQPDQSLAKDTSKYARIVETDKPVDANQKVTVKSILLKYVNTVPLTPPLPAEIPVLASLEVSFTKSNSFGAPEITRKIPIYAKTQGGKMTFCSLSFSAGLMLKDLACKLSPMGYQHWNPNVNPTGVTANPPVGDCVDDPVVQWFNGTGLSAKCPAGMKVGVADIETANPTMSEREKASYVCKINSPPYFTPAPRFYTDGSSDSTPLYVAEPNLNIASSTCTFDIPAGKDGSAYVNRMRCVPDL